MSAVNIDEVVSQGDPIKITIKNGKGTSDVVYLQVKISVEPTDEIPDVLAKLSLPSGHFSFSGKSTKDIQLGGKKNGDTVTIKFFVDCDTSNPSSTMGITVAVQDEFDQPTTEKNLTYKVVKK